jgi:hypothetical protein
VRRPSFRARTAEPALAGPRLDRSVAAGLRAANPSRKPRAEKTAARFTLPGPTLPHELTSLSGAGISAPISPRPRREPPKRSLPAWVVSLVVAATLVTSMLGLAIYFMPGMLAGSPPPANAEAKATAAPQPVALPPDPKAPPISKYVEVTGFRFVTTRDRGSSIHYIVVNHSAAMLSDVTVNVTLRARAAQASQPPLSQFSFPLPDLGPYESREMVSPIERITRPGVLPEWQDLDVQVNILQ